MPKHMGKLAGDVETMTHPNKGKKKKKRRSPEMRKALTSKTKY